MERYAPTMKDLASRDVVSRSIYMEIREGRGIGGERYVHLDATHLGREVVESKLPDIADFCRTYLGIDPAVDPIPIQPTAHYAMGGIPTDVDGRVVIDEERTPLPGIYAAGECACVSVHGANRLGTNSLLDIVVFGKRAGLDMARFCQENDLPPLPDDTTEPTRERLGRLREGRGTEIPAKIREEMQETMMKYVGVFREEEGGNRAIGEIRTRKETCQESRDKDQCA